MRAAAKFVFLFLKFISDVVTGCFSLIGLTVKTSVWIVAIPFATVFGVVVLLFVGLAALFMPVSRVEKLKALFAKAPRKKVKRKLHPVFNSLK
jgi:arginine exporter protein ArgO